MENLNNISLSPDENPENNPSKESVISKEELSVIQENLKNGMYQKVSVMDAENEANLNEFIFDNESGNWTYEVSAESDKGNREVWVKDLGQTGWIIVGNHISSCNRKVVLYSFDANEKPVEFLTEDGPFKNSTDGIPMKSSPWNESYEPTKDGFRKK